MSAPSANEPIYSAQSIVDYYQQRGLKIVQTSSCWWYNEFRRKRMYYAFPPHRIITPTSEEIRTLFHALPDTLVLRFLSPSTSSGTPSFIWTCRNPYDLTTLESKARNQVRRGRERCQIRSLTIDDLLRLGWQAHSDTMRRHGHESFSFGLNAEMKNCSAYEYWGAFVGDDLAAYLVTLWVEDWVHILINRSADIHRKLYPNNALLFTVVQELLARPGVSTISYGWESLEPHESLEHYKASMGFEKLPVRQRMIFRPWVGVFLNPAVCKILANVFALRLNNSRWQRLAGFFRIASGV